MNWKGKILITLFFLMVTASFASNIFGLYLMHDISQIKSEIDVQRQEIRQGLERLEQVIGDIDAGAEKLTHPVEKVKVLDVTAYSPRKIETDSDPHITASMKKVKQGQIAVSRDLFYKGWVFGKKVYIEGHGIYVIADLMHKRFSDRIDIFFPKTKDAKSFGKKQLRVALLAG